MPELTNCRFCDGEVSTTAQKCKHCGEWLTNKANSFDMQPQPQNTFILSCAFSGLLFIAALSFIFKGEYIPSLAAFAMSLILLPYFANVISNRYSLKIQKWHKIFVCILMLIIIGATSKNTDSTIAENPSQEQDTQQESTPQNDVEKVYQVGDTAKVGYMTYKVNGINWQKRIGDQYFGCDANSNYLAVDIAVQNNDKQSRMVPAFTLVDQNGNKYQADTKSSIYLGEKAFILDDLNPSVSKEGLLLFDVPKNNTYKLLLSGGYWSLDETYIQLN